MIDEKTRAGLRTVFLPPHDVVVPGADNVNPTDEDDIRYNEWCTQQIKQALNDVKAENEKRLKWFEDHPDQEIPEYLEKPMVMTQYPRDTVERGNDSRDVVSLDRDGEVVVLDSGVR